MRASVRFVVALSVVALVSVFMVGQGSSVDTALAQPTPTPSPSWSVSFTDAVDPIALGATETWTLIGANPAVTSFPTPATATATLTGFTGVVATAPSGWTCTSTSTSTISCTNPLPPTGGGTAPTITITGTAATCGTTTASATISGGGASATTVTSPTTITCTGPTISKIDAVDPINVGQTETWTITVTNTDSSTFFGGTTVTDAVPSNFTNVAASGTGWSCSVTGNNVSCSRSDSLGAGASYPPITVTAVASTCGNVSNTAQLAASVSLSTGARAQAVAPPTASATATTTITCAAPVLGIAKTDAVDPVTTGQAESWSVVISNGAGSSAAPSAPATGTFTVSDTVPAEFGGVAAAGAGWSCTVQGNTVTCTRTDTLTVNASLPPIIIQGTAVLCGGTVTNTARLTFVSSTSSTGGQTATLSSSAATTILCRPTVTPIVPGIEIPPVAIITPTATPTFPPTTPQTQAPATATATTPPATSTATATRSATATVTQPPATTTRPPTATPTIPPATATMTTQPPGTPQGVQYQSGRYISGANPLREGQTTRIEVTYVLTNNTNEVVDYGNTVTFDLAEGVSAAAAVPTRGSATISARQVAWGGFALGPGESASITMTLDVTPATNTAGRAVTLITGTTTTGRTASGGFLNVQGGGLTSAAISGLANGGLVAAAVPGGAPAALPRTGSGSSGAQRGWLAVAGALVVLGGGLLAFLRPRSRRRA